MGFSAKRGRAGQAGVAGRMDSTWFSPGPTFPCFVAVTVLCLYVRLVLSLESRTHSLEWGNFWMWMKVLLALPPGPNQEIGESVIPFVPRTRGIFLECVLDRGQHSGNSTQPERYSVLFASAGKWEGLLAGNVFVPIFIPQIPITLCRAMC